MSGKDEKSRPTIWRKMVLASRLDVDLYEEVEADTRANGQAASVVVLTSLATGIGAGISGLVVNGGLWLLWGLLVGMATSIVGWLAWAFLAYWVGKTIFKGPQTEVTYGQLLRTLGFASSPGVLRIFAFVPLVGGLIAFVATVWVLIAGVVAIRQALDFTTWRAIGTALVGWLVYLLLILLITILFAGTGDLIQTPV
jgi:hypothetical protein